MFFNDIGIMFYNGAHGPNPGHPDIGQAMISGIAFGLMMHSFCNFSIRVQEKLGCRGTVLSGRLGPEQSDARGTGSHQPGRSAVQVRRASRAGQSACPQSVRAYSTRGGTSG